MTDRQPVLVHFAGLFAEKYTQINMQNLEETYETLQYRFSECFEIEHHPAARIVIQKLKEQFNEEFERISEDAEHVVLQIKAWNQEPLCYSICEDQLAQHYNSFEVKENQDTEDDHACRIMREVEAYLEYQSSLITEASFKQIVNALYARGRDILIKVVKDNIKDIVQ